MALLMGGVARAQPADAPSATDDPAAEARGLFQQGLQHYDARRFADALDAFERSATAFPSPNSRLYVARCLRELGRLAESVDAYDATIAAADADAVQRPRYADTRRAAQDERGRLEPSIARLRIVARDPLPPEARVLVAGRLVERARWADPLPVNPGRLTVAIERPGVATERHEVALNAGQTTTLELQRPAVAAVEVAARPPTRRTAVWIAAGVAVAGAAGGTVFWRLADARYRELRDRCGDGPCPPGQDGDIDRGRTFQTLTNVGWIVAAAGSVAAIALAFTTRGRDEGVRIGVAPGAVSIAGSF